jgi:hypothetical protein
VLHAARHRRYDRDGGLLRSIDQAAAKLNCKSFSGKADGLDKTWAVENARDTLKDAIGKWTAGAKGAATQSAAKPPIHPYWRESISPDLFLPPDVVTKTDYTICWKDVVSPVVCASGAKLCW